MIKIPSTNEMVNSSTLASNDINGTINTTYTIQIITNSLNHEMFQFIYSLFIRFSTFNDIICKSSVIYHNYSIRVIFHIIHT